MNLNLAEASWMRPEDAAKRAAEVMAELSPVEQELARTLLAQLAAHYLTGGPNHETVRQALRVLAFCSAATVAATDVHTRKVKSSFVNFFETCFQKLMR